MRALKFIIISISLLSLIIACDEQEEDVIIIAMDANGNELDDSEDLNQYTPRCLPFNDLDGNIICVNPTYPNPTDGFAGMRINSIGVVLIDVNLFKDSKLVFEIYSGLITAGTNQFEIPSFDLNGNELEAGIYKVEYSYTPENSTEVIKGYGYVQRL